MLLNETGGTFMSHAITGLTVGQAYSLSFEYWGDNRPGSFYSFNYGINGATIGSGLLSWATFSLPHLVTYNFVAGSASTTLFFQETSPSQASPLFDNIVVSSVGAVPEPSSLALLCIGGLGMVGRAFRRRKVTQG